MNPTLEQRFAANRGQIDSWLGMARIGIRRGEAKRALECMWSALWLLGFERTVR